VLDVRFKKSFMWETNIYDKLIICYIVGMLEFY